MTDNRQLQRKDSFQHHISSTHTAKPPTPPAMKQVVSDGRVPSGVSARLVASKPQKYAAKAGVLRIAVGTVPCALIGIDTVQYSISSSSID